MEEIFIKRIVVNEVRNIKDFQIPLSDSIKKNLIITGKNGSGKTSLLRELKKYLNNIINGNLSQFDFQIEYLENLKKQQVASQKVKKLDIANKNQIRDSEDWFAEFGGTTVELNHSNNAFSYFVNGIFIVAFFEAKRNTTFQEPTGINRVQFNSKYNFNDNAGKDFIQYIVNLKADRSFAKDDNDNDTVAKIDTWFVDFEKNLAQLFENENIKLEFDRKSYNFNIIEESKEPYNLNQLSDGYSAILNIVTELIMRMEEHKTKSYDVQGVVLIDEIETHLHIELQKRVLPFLTSFFPKIQFIVTTHSPFVLSSIQNAVICDLEKRIVTSDLSGYSYDTLVESYFESDKYSIELKKQLKEFERLNEKKELTDKEEDDLLNLEMDLNAIPKYLSDELAVKLQQIKLKGLNPNSAQIYPV